MSDKDELSEAMEDLKQASYIGVVADSMTFLATSDEVSGIPTIIVYLDTVVTRGSEPPVLGKVAFEFPIAPHTDDRTRLDAFLHNLCNAIEALEDFEKAQRRVVN